MPSIFHLALPSDVDRAARSGVYRPASFDADGFIHCSHAHQVAPIAATHFRDVPTVSLLEIDTARLETAVVEEGTSETFPHLQGPLPMSAVVSVRELVRGADGQFVMPCSVTGVCACKGG